VARESESSNATAVNTAHGWSHNGAATGNAPADQVDWAGLPVNLDLAFSQNQRDKVYAQHLMRRRGTVLRRRSRDVTPLCSCGVADCEHLSLYADRAVSSH
jgi:hypothetical protein